MLFDLTGGELIGEYTAYGALTKGVVSGYIHLRKAT
jgi:hypothetical protein